MRKLFFFSVLLLGAISIAHAIDLSPSINPQIPGVDATGGPSAIIKSFYLFAMAFGGALALAMVIWGGIQMMVARGNTGQISEAKDRITQALFGLLLLAGAYIILNTINPKLTDLSLPKLEAVREVGEATPSDCTPALLCGKADGCCYGTYVCRQKPGGSGDQAYQCVDPYGKCGDPDPAIPGLCPRVDDTCLVVNGKYVCQPAPTADQLKYYACVDPSDPTHIVCNGSPATKETLQQCLTRCKNDTGKCAEAATFCGPQP